ncbi:LOW QUALITY PROTEIN: formin-like protein 11 [Actinidia eriantha]|uniref:LOW QUALITY PROTEIN: formin-like protein 11 n=1 Tax=Actinidia eriantha TaxID=165200 RepID=UPI00258D9D0A|nr:LOW QUALITY PROTEIN: formin-like protein 11 [Actinidia eriantha]
MGFVLYKIFIITFLLISLQNNTHSVGVSFHEAAELFNGDGRERGIEKVSGEDEREGEKALILEKFRALLGLKNFEFKNPQIGVFDYGSPSPSPSPTIEAPAPVPVHPISVHHHLPFRRHRPIPRHRKAHNEDRDGGRRAKRIIIAVSVSAGATFVLCGIGFFFFCIKFRRQKKRSKRPVVSKYLSSQNSVKKVSSDPGLDLFYLDSLGAALEGSETVNKLLNQNTSRSEREQVAVRSESSAAGEIVSVHDESGESVKYDSDRRNTDCGESSSSDDESFHSLCDSHLSNTRLSNTSAASLSDKSEFLSPKGSNKSPSCVKSPMDLPYKGLPLAPPPPPRPLPSLCSSRLRISPSHSCSSSTRITSRALGSSTLPILSSPRNSRCSLTSKALGSSALPILSSPRNSDCSSTSKGLGSSTLPILSSPRNSDCSSTRVTSKDLGSSTLPILSPPRNSDSSSGSNQTPQRDLTPSPPNPPPRPLAGIPPPPCPPPFSNANTYSLKTPPPPPSQFMQLTPMGKNGAPLPKLKPLHWDKVRAVPNRSTVWDKMRSSSFEFDEEMIESLFGYNLQNPMKSDEVKSKSPSPSKHVLDPKRLQNITILSKALNVTADQVCDALLQGEGLCLQQLEALVKMVPTKEEEAKLSSYKGDVNELGSAERFVKAMLKIPFAFLRIEAMLYRETFEDEVVHLRKSFSVLEEACKELRSSRLFLKLLEAILKTGNRMNVGTIRGGAKAFKLDTLLKLADVKGTDGKTTLLHFVVQEIVRSEGIRVSESIMGKINQRSKIRNAEEREEDYRRMGLDLVSGLSIELCNAKKTATIDLDVLASSVSNLSEGMTKLKHLVGKDLCLDEKSGKFAQLTRKFLGHAEKSIKELREDEGRVLRHVREITEYFHGDVSKDEANPLRIFVIVRDFLGMLDHVCKELRSSKVPSSPNPLASFR